MANAAELGPPAILMVIASLSASLAIIVVGLRFSSRRLIGAPLMADDWMVLPAVVR
jgi:hypothetical protein